MGSRIFSINQRFGRLVVVNDIGLTPQHRSLCLCHCDCGNEKVILQRSLRNGKTKSCGCLSREKTVQRNWKHGLCGTTRYRLLMGAKYRAAKLGIPFSLTLTDIEIPSHCPILGIRLEARSKSKGGHHANSPTLDRLHPDKGHVLGNVWIISYEANRLKNNATPKELQQLATAVKIKLTYHRRKS